MIKELLGNATLLVTLIVLYELISRWKTITSLASGIISGILFGGIAVICMNVPITYANGIFYDARIIVLSLAGLFGGPISVCISVLLAGSYRLWTGGPGIWAGMASILSSALIGLVVRFLFHGRPQKITGLCLLGMGFLSSAAMLLCQLLLPRAMAPEVIAHIWLPVFLLFPVTSLIAGVFLKNGLIRQQSEEALRNSEILHHSLTELSPIGIFRADSEGKNTYVNPQYCMISGLSPEQAGGDGWLNNVHPEDKNKLAEVLSQAVSEKKNVSEEFRFLKPGNQITWVLCDIVPEITKNGKLHGYIGT
ncbi:MAG: LytS/YhcK type 5TM receptor domain-containing protein, partial [Mangrovibacterium sp.]